MQRTNNGRWNTTGQVVETPSQLILDQSQQIRENNLAEPQIPQEILNLCNPTSNSKSF